MMFPASIAIRISESTAGRDLPGYSDYRLRSGSLL